MIYYICIFSVHIHVIVYIYIWLSMHMICASCIYIYIYICTYICDLCTCTHICIYTCRSVFAPWFMCFEYYKCEHVGHVYVYIYANIRTYEHAHTCIYMWTPSSLYKVSLNFPPTNRQSWQPGSHRQGLHRRLESKPLEDGLGLPCIKVYLYDIYIYIYTWLPDAWLPVNPKMNFGVAIENTYTSMTVWGRAISHLAASRLICI